MKPLVALLMASVALLAGGPEKSKPLRSELSTLEKAVNARLQAMFPNEPWLVLGFTRGMYVGGVGVIFSAEVNLVTGPTLMSVQQPSKEQIAALHDKRLSRLPKLRDTMSQVLKDIAAVPAVGPEERVVFSVTVLRYPYETYTDVPSQIVVHAAKGKLATPKVEEY